MTDRSSRREVRNPVLALPHVEQLRAQPPASREALRAILIDLKKASAAKAHECLRKHKWPMAVYWKAVSVYSGHIAKVLA